MDSPPGDNFISAFANSQVALRAFCRSSIGNFNDAQDVFQSTCLVLWKKAGDWDPNTPFLRWAFTVARYEVLAYVRDRARDRHLFDEDVVLAMAGAAERIISARPDRFDALEVCLGRLNQAHRETLADHYVRGLTMKEIANQRGCSVSAVKVMIMRLRNTLADCIEHRLATQAQRGTI